MRSIEQVERDLTQLRKASGQLGEELMAAYKGYFASLAPTLKQQSIQGCYYLCTNCYPESFLKLDYNRRSQLLRTLQRSIGNVIKDMAVHFDPNAPKHTDDDDEETTGELTSISMTPVDYLETPSSLAAWQENVEAEIAHGLKEISYKANLLLQQAQVLPVNIPKPILEANPEVDRQGNNASKVPNLLTVLVQKENSQGNTNEEELDEDRPQDSSELIDRDIIKIHTLLLRLSEVEFADAEVLEARKNIARLVSKIREFKREYMRKQQDLKVAQAESAWRSCWFE